MAGRAASLDERLAVDPIIKLELIFNSLELLFTFGKKSVLSIMVLQDTL